MKQKIINIVGIFFLVIGITLLLYPEIISYLKQKQSDQTVKELTQRRSKRKQDDLLYQKAVRYNRKIFKEKQAGLKDVFSYRSAPIVLRNEKNTFGYIKIPKMKQKQVRRKMPGTGQYRGMKHRNRYVAVRINAGLMIMIKTVRSVRKIISSVLIKSRM